MPLTFIYAIGLVLLAALSVYAPHARGFCMTLGVIFSACLVVVGLFEAFQRRSPG
ncbi:hypothetical protein [Acidomonas methanolica]|uniref:Uncharacterized protein n=1 Tax=Acidomonas methanolica NBRC 104435 TaxID=1231351 RepID=A0A023D5U4_ACIMT|nr:hypothetical protein [Acidomonas methanolica]MBU2654867.1 hypothetical protein [Acidomonas methanolica]TCS24770.1 hypothetical protein EDC31_12122 [Acidomonas methanolica]GAJ29161.1 hypothetical protein Amme_050_004 [Acidomonas methanolica NBRC 104435]GBQ60447.1 hypothetical protein AA0498_2858 [Acidomonas methanolica]GEK99848.1 hypothetical protein AME01nite_23470 [Acidomonas methanolica NBRC 104435]